MCKHAPLCFNQATEYMQVTNNTLVVTTREVKPINIGMNFTSFNSSVHDDMVSIQTLAMTSIFNEIVFGHVAQVARHITPANSQVTVN